MIPQGLGNNIVAIHTLGCSVSLVKRLAGIREVGNAGNEENKPSELHGNGGVDDRAVDSGCSASEDVPVGVELG